MNNILAKALGLPEEDETPLMLRNSAVPEEVAPSAPIVSEQQAPIHQDINPNFSPKEAYLERALPAPQDIIYEPSYSGGFIPSESDQEKEARLQRLQQTWNKIQDLEKNKQTELQTAKNADFKSEIFAAIGNYLPGVVAGATAMNTKASVQPAKMAEIKATDNAGNLEKRYKTDYENLLNQYKQFSKDGLSLKDMMQMSLQQQMSNARQDGLKIQAQSANENRRMRHDSARQQEEQRIESNIQKLGADTTMAQDVHNTLGEIDEILGVNVDELKVEKGKVLNKEGKPLDLPGVSIPGIGRINAHSDKAQTLESAMGRIFNKELKDRSGSAVTSPELDRLRIEFAQGKFNTESQMIQAIQRYKKAVAHALKNVESKYEKHVLDEYKDRGGISSDKFSKQLQQDQFKEINGVKYKKVQGGWARIK